MAVTQKRADRRRYSRDADDEAGGAAIQVLVVSEVRLHRESLEAVLGASPEINVIGTAETLVKAARAFLESEVVLLDVAMGPGPQGLREMIREHPDVRVLAVGVSEFGPDVLALAEAGVDGYLTVDATTKQLSDAVRGVVRGETPCSAATVRTLLRALGERSENGHTADGSSHVTEERLTEREIEVLTLIARGLSNKEIAQLLFIEVATVKNHVHSILQKLNLHRRAHAANWLRHQNPEVLDLHQGVPASSDDHRSSPKDLDLI